MNSWMDCAVELVMEAWTSRAGQRKWWMGEPVKRKADRIGRWDGMDE